MANPQNRYKKLQLLHEECEAVDKVVKDTQSCLASDKNVLAERLKKAYGETLKGLGEAANAGQREQLQLFLSTYLSVARISQPEGWSVMVAGWMAYLRLAIVAQSES